MTSQATTIIDEVSKILQERDDIVALVLYGSRAQGTATENSDYDFGVIYDNPKDTSSWISRATMLAEQVNEALGLPEKTISIIDLNNVPHPLAFNALNGSLIFQRDTARYYNEIVRISNLYEENYLRESI